jgi:F0F1-type ATP synthase assembly protein I
MASRTILEELVTVLGFEYKDDGSREKFQRASSKIAETAKSLWVGIAGIVATGAITTLNALTATQEKQADIIGFSGQAFREWAGIAKDAGFEAEHLTDLVEEMNNKIGEAKGLSELITPVKESLQILNIEFETLKQLKPEEQFNLLANSIVDLQDKQAAVSAADILFGGEANKFFSYLKSREISIGDALSQQRELILLTDEEAKASRAWGREIGNLWKLFISAGQSISGMLAMTGIDLKAVRIGFADWFRENREGMQFVISSFVEFLKIFVPIIAAFKLLNVLVGIFNVIAGAGPIGVIIVAFLALAAAIMLVRKNWEKIKGFFKGGNQRRFTPEGQEIFEPETPGEEGGVIGIPGTIKKEVVVPAGQSQNVVNQNNTINIKSDNPMATGLATERIIKNREDQAALNFNPASF